MKFLRKSKKNKSKSIETFEEDLEPEEDLSVCPECKSQNIYFDNGTGETIYCVCGLVLKEETLSFEVVSDEF